jgi:ankyrin repeat protein
LAGFFCGTHIPILVCGEKAIESIPKVYAFCFKFLKTEAELNDHLASEYEASKKNEAAQETNHARQALLDKGIPATVDAFAQCVAEDKVDEVSLFLAAGFSPDSKDKKGVPLLALSARNGHLKPLELLLRSGAQVNLTAEDRGSTALFDATMGRHIDLVKALIEAGADTNIQSKDKQSALVVAVGAGDEKIVEILVKAGADPDIEDSLGVSARKYAALFKKSTMIAMFNDNASVKAS